MLRVERHAVGPSEASLFERLAYLEEYVVVFNPEMLTENYRVVLRVTPGHDQEAIGRSHKRPYHLKRLEEQVTTFLREFGAFAQKLNSKCYDVAQDAFFQAEFADMGESELSHFVLTQVTPFHCCNAAILLPA